MTILSLVCDGISSLYLPLFSINIFNSLRCFLLIEINFVPIRQKLKSKDILSHITLDLTRIGCFLVVGVVIFNKILLWGLNTFLEMNCKPLSEISKQGYSSKVGLLNNPKKSGSSNWFLKPVTQYRL